MSKAEKTRNRSSVGNVSTSHALTMPTGWGILQRIVRKVASDPARSIAVSLLVTACASASVNAMYLQTIKHPSPLFGAETVAPVSSTLPDPVPVPVARSAAFSGTIAGFDPAATNAGSFSPSILPDVVNSTGKSDGIGDLISGMNSKPLVPNRTVLLAQKALGKLGYAVKADGVSGGTTRQAIEKFERDNRLPVKGDLSPRVLRELSMAAGFPVE